MELIIMHLTRDDRYTIENNLSNNISLKQIGRNINKHCSCISREIKNHYITKNTGSVYIEELVLIEEKIAILGIVLNLLKKNVLF